MKIPTTQDLKNSKFAREIRKAANSNFIARIIVLAIIWSVALVPTWLYLLVRALIDPVGFWQEIALFGLFAILLGWAQFILAIVGSVMSLVTIFDDI